MNKYFSLNSNTVSILLFFSLIILLMLPALSQMQDIFLTEGFDPHAHCFLWNLPILRMYVVSDSLIGVSYMAISTMLVVMHRRFNQVLPYSWLILAFAAFIFSCGITHFMDVWTLWNPTYRLSAYTKFITAVVSAGTAFIIPPLIPKYVRIVNTAKVSEDRKQQLIFINSNLEAQIAENRRTLEALRLSEQRLLKVIENAPVILSTFDKDGTITMIEGHGLTRLNLKQGDLVGKSYTEITDDQSVKNAIVETLSGKEKIVVTDTDGIVFENRYSPLTDEEDQITGVIAVSLDITERLAIETELRNAYEKEHELNMLRARFITRMSHEFRTPLSVISTSIQMLTRYADKMTEEKRAARVQNIYDQISMMTNILDNVLYVEKIEEQQLDFSPELVDLNTYCGEVVGIFNASNGASRVAYTGNEAHFETFIDRQLFSLILSKLIENAIQYSPQDTMVLVELDYDNDDAIITVTDQGLGIPNDNKAYIFDRFYRGDNIEGIPGTGLGLSIAKSAVDAHEAKISFFSEVGTGTTFTVKFPVSQLTAEL
ncbi:MAG: ATP-binding protein [Aggregatilineales bacterium]